MSKFHYFFLGIILYFPAWAFKGGFPFNEKILILLFFYILPIIFHYFLFLYISKKFDYKLCFYLSLIFTYSIDQNYGLMGYMSQVPNFLNINNYALYNYISGLVILTTMIIILFIFFYKLNFNGVKIMFAFSLVALIINIFDNRNSNHFNENFYFEKDKELTTVNKTQKTLVLILDEVSGINSFESSHPSGLKTKNEIENLFKKWGFIYYRNAYSLSQSTTTSLPLLLNFKNDESKSVDELGKYVLSEGLIEQNNSYYLVENDLIKNAFFDKSDTKNITVFQNMGINYCGHPNVSSCLHYNPFKRNYEYLSGVRNPNLSRVISLWKLHGSIISNYTWRILRIKLIDNTLEPYGEKMISQHYFNTLYDHIKLKPNNIIFAHTLLSHKPYGFDNNCNYDGKRSHFYSSMTINQKVTQNNIERSCVVALLDEFFQKLKNDNLFKNLNIAILSDHGSRISKKNMQQSYRSAIFAIKKDNKQFHGSDEKLSIQHLFSKYFN